MLNEKRLKEIILCLLAPIADNCEMDKETYLNWLRLEVGISEDELKMLSNEGYLPIPMDAIERD